MSQFFFDDVCDLYDYGGRSDNEYDDRSDDGYGDMCDMCGMSDDENDLSHLFARPTITTKISDNGHNFHLFYLALQF